MLRRRIGWTLVAVVLSGAAAFLGSACTSAKIAAGGLEIEITGDDGFIVAARGWEKALRMSLDHVTELERNPKENRAAILDWNEIIGKIIVAKQKQGERQF